MSIADIKKVKIELSEQRMIPKITFKQYDTNEIHFVIYKGKDLLSPSEFQRASVNFKRNDGVVYSEDLDLDNGKLVYRLGNNVMANKGPCKLTLQLFKNGERRSSSEISVMILQNIESGEIPPTLEDALSLYEQIKEIQKELEDLVGHVDGEALEAEIDALEIKVGNLEVLISSLQNTSNGISNNIQSIENSINVLDSKVQENKERVEIQGKMPGDFEDWKELSAYIKDNKIRYPGYNSNGQTKIILPPGIYYIDDFDILADANGRTSGLTFSGSGRDVTIVRFTPSEKNKYLFKNDDKMLNIHFEDMTFEGDLSMNTNFMISTSHGGAQNFTFTRCYFVDFDRVLDLRGTNTNSEFSFYHCGFYGAIKDGVLFVGDEGTSSASDQFLNYNFYACQFEVLYGNFVNMKYGGNINVFGGSFIHVESDSETAIGGDFFKLRNNVHGYSVCRLLVSGVRFELRNRNSRIINSEWQAGHIEFLNCESGAYSQNEDSIDWQTARFSGVNSFPVIKFDNCGLLGKHHYEYNVSGSGFVNSIQYDSCHHFLSQTPEDMFTYSTLPGQNFYNHGSKPSITLRKFRVGSGKSAVYDTTLNGTIHGKTILEKKVLSLKDASGGLPRREGSETVVLPPDSIITKVVLFCPSNAVTSGYTADFTVKTNEIQPTVLAETLPLGNSYRQGFNVQSDVWLVCDTLEKRTITIVDNEGVDQTTTKGLCLIEYI